MLNLFHSKQNLIELKLLMTPTWNCTDTPLTVRCIVQYTLDIKMNVKIVLKIDTYFTSSSILIKLSFGKWQNAIKISMEQLQTGKKNEHSSPAKW